MNNIDDVIRLTINRLGDALHHQLNLVKDIENLAHQAAVNPSRINDLKRLLANLRDLRERLRNEMNILYRYPINSKELALDAETLVLYYIEAAWKTEHRILEMLNRILDTRSDINEVNENKILAEKLINKLRT
ncbi:MAG: hypothetical protein F7C81_01930 [Desulfurococcales archaeon]|nr:hypothetical protein [Desulfurococcales archaeon]MEB3780470.1 hypothetical protein [Desulfurococcales archaeon]